MDVESNEQKMDSCHCLFDVCCGSEGKNETLLSSIAERITLFMEKNMIKWLNQVCVAANTAVL